MSVASFRLSLAGWDTGLWTPEFFHLSEEIFKKSCVTRSVHNFVWTWATAPSDFFYLTEGLWVLLQEVRDLSGLQALPCLEKIELTYTGNCPGY